MRSTVIKTTLKIMWRVPQIPAHSSSSITWCWKHQDLAAVMLHPPRPRSVSHTSWDVPGSRGAPRAARAHHTSEIPTAAVNIFSQHILSVLNTSKPQAENENSWPRWKGSAAAEHENIQEIQNNVNYNSKGAFMALELTGKRWIREFSFWVV